MDRTTSSRQLEGPPHALGGGVAVLVHVQGHRVTQDIDRAVLALKVDVQQRLQVMADVELTKGSDVLVVLANGVPVDVLTAGHNPPRRGIGALMQAKAHAVRWAIQTAVATTIEADPPGRRGPIIPADSGIATRAQVVVPNAMRVQPASFRVSEPAGGSRGPAQPRRRQPTRREFDRRAGRSR